MSKLTFNVKSTNVVGEIGRRLSKLHADQKIVLRAEIGTDILFDFEEAGRQLSRFVTINHDLEPNEVSLTYMPDTDQARKRQSVTTLLFQVDN